MKKKSTLLLTLLLGSLLCLSGCSLFNDDDIAVVNKYNPATVVPEEEEEDPDAVKAQGVVGKEVANVPNTLCFKNIGYAPTEVVTNTYKEGGENYVEYNVNSGQDYSATRSSNNYDLYVPN